MNQQDVTCIDGNDSLFTSLQRPKRQQRRHGIKFNDLHEDGDSDVPLVQAVMFVAAGFKITVHYQTSIQESWPIVTTESAFPLTLTVRYQSLYGFPW